MSKACSRGVDHVLAIDEVYDISDSSGVGTKGEVNTAVVLISFLNISGEQV